jgi:hypothetical protein
MLCWPRMTTFSTVFSRTVYSVFFSFCPAILFLFFRRKLYRRLIFFTVYLVSLFIWGIVELWISRTPIYSSHRWFDVFWSVEFALSTLRLLTIAEISRRFLRGYPAVWTLAAWLLSGVATALLLWTVQSAIHNVHHVRRFILLGDQRFECMQAILLLLVLLIGVYYRLQIPLLYRLILTGIGIYACVQVTNNPLGINQLILPNSTFDFIRRGSILISLGTWLYAIWRSPRIPDVRPELISQATYDELAPQIHDRMRDLNDKLSRLIKR